MLTKEQIEILKYCEGYLHCDNCKFGLNVPCEIEEVDTLGELLAAYDRIAELEGEVTRLKTQIQITPDKYVYYDGNRIDVQIILRKIFLPQTATDNLMSDREETIKEREGNA